MLQMDLGIRVGLHNGPAVIGLGGTADGIAITFPSINEPRLMTMSQTQSPTLVTAFYHLKIISPKLPALKFPAIEVASSQILFQPSHRTPMQSALEVRDQASRPMSPARRACRYHADTQEGA
jgi:hypothetical protein